MRLLEREEERRQQEAAARRVAERAERRRGNERVLAAPGGIAEADTPERIAERIDRLNRFHGAGKLVEPAAAAPAARLEKIINTVDYVGVRYLDAGVVAARTVGRVDIRDDRGRPTGYGTGSMVSASLLLTNHHVLPDIETARASVIEFDFQDGVDGRPLAPRTFPLDPDRFFVADAGLDFALVAVTSPPGGLEAYGHNRLVEAEGKAIIGEFVTIIQHPRGDKKQVALRENKIVDIPERHLHYAADTEPGSSGSPVFNDQWEVVALHHASVPVPGQEELGGFVNEGVRISRVCRAVREAPLPPGQRALADEIFAPARVEQAGAAAPASAGSLAAASAPLAAPAPSGGLNLVVPGPIDITVRLADGDGRAAGERAAASEAGYSDREGYDPAFLARPLPPPLPPPELAAAASAELRYHHFSVVMHRRRKLALFTACNIDGGRSRRPRRGRDRWSFDPRLPAAEQTGEEVYADPELDRGHLVRRLDPAWGTEAQAEAACADTFHYTNASPQHHGFNAGETLWRGLEDHILGNADNRDLTVSVFTGPVLAPDDPVHRGTALPRGFWKIVAMTRKSGELSVTGYLLSQAALIAGLPGEEEFSYGAYRTYQVPVRAIGILTGLDLDAHVRADPLEGREAFPVPREVARPEDLVL
ncbi:DNA/RNA non-specific endonuclease [Actinomadura sp. WAC 06369]|uniref:DNA/RNA non-specific endonuclease n=1 Tax=Actinomadura sp. WAC 06369 TaxID=2203193 RepID=UPI000F76C478|nr:DNA/RNA non-specific endonuclease [Actinomadura sp. WAC 06369]RSN64387.1 endonuclease [Actinomadura sp. WAC 06369]